MPRLALAILIVASLSLTRAHGQEPEEGIRPISAISERMRPFVDDREVAGVVTLVATPDRIVHLDAIGSADLATGKPMRPDTIFWIASMTKPITATAVLMLQCEPTDHRRALRVTMPPPY